MALADSEYSKRYPSDWRAAIIYVDSTLQDAIECLNNSTLQIVLVVSSSNQYLGSLTDGDIRRGILRGLSLNSAIDSIINKNSLTIDKSVGRHQAMQMMQANGIHHLPILDIQKNVVGLYTFDDLVKRRHRENVVVIMAGGKGVRLLPHTENCPKPMLLVGDMPILEHVLRGAIEDGFSNFVFSIGYLGHMIEEYFGNGHSWGVTINYLREKKPLGTAGAISQLVPINPEPLVVINGDVLTSVNYGDLVDYHVKHLAIATMAIRMHESRSQFGVVNVNGIEIEGFEEKPILRSYINAGVYCLSVEAIAQLQKDQYCDMPSLFEVLRTHSLRTIVYPIHEPWMDVGRPDDLDRARLGAESV